MAAISPTELPDFAREVAITVSRARSTAVMPGQLFAALASAGPSLARSSGE